MGEIHKISELLKTIRNKINSNTDVLWTEYDNPTELQNQIDNKISELKKGNIKVLNDVEVWFLPTGTFQELSLSNAWAEEYLVLAQKFDSLYKKLSDKM